MTNEGLRTTPRGTHLQLVPTFADRLRQLAETLRTDHGGVETLADFHSNQTAAAGQDRQKLDRLPQEGTP